MGSYVFVLFCAAITLGVIAERLKATKGFFVVFGVLLTLFVPKLDGFREFGPQTATLWLGIFGSAVLSYWSVRGVRWLLARRRNIKLRKGFAQSANRAPSDAGDALRLLIAWFSKLWSLHKSMLSAFGVISFFERYSWPYFVMFFVYGMIFAPLGILYATAAICASIEEENSTSG